MTVYLNGEFLEQEKAAVSVADRGFIFGDGIYEVIRVVEGKLIMENEHLSRMDEGLQGLRILLDKGVRSAIPEINRKLLKKNGHLTGEATVYLQITRGAALPRTHEFPKDPVSPTLFLSTHAFTPHKKLHETGTDAITLPDVRWSRCNLKTINLLPNTLAKQSARDAGVNSAVMIRDGVITESPNANIFCVKSGVLYTYPSSNYILNGITRRAVVSIASDENIPLVQEPVREADIPNLEELFFSGTTTDIQPVTMIDGNPVGNGKPGPVTRTIQKAYGHLLYGESAYG
mgnify:CR=1 FL=1